MKGRPVLIGGLLLLLPFGADAAGRGPDPDWPCQQLLVPMIAPAMVWNGPSLVGIGDWRSESKVAALVERIAPRGVPTEQGESAIAEFGRTLTGDRKRFIALAFAGVLDETNRQRGEVIGRIKALAERQRSLADLIARLTAQLDATPEPPPGEPASPERADLVQRWTFTQRSYNELDHTMRYACDVPVQLDARLGAYARALQAALS
jgi:hypothetical protein